MFTQNDTKQIEAKGISLEKAEKQMAYFRSGFPYLPIDRAAIVGDGIVSLPENMVDSLALSYDMAIETGGVDVLKFVPASGAATRMFKELYEYIAEPVGKESATVDKVFEQIKNFAFYQDLVALGVDLADKKAVIGAIIEHGLDYGKMPKGMIKFHHYDGENGRTSLEEHLVEGALYGGGNNIKIHFTISPEHQSGFEQLVSERAPFFETKYGVKYQISYSIQRSSTDTLAVDLQNNPFRQDDGNLLFRPAGHGALIDNLDDLKADIIFIKTIDNVEPDHLKNDTVRYKKALAAMAIGLRAQIFEYISQIDRGEASAEEIITFLDNSIGYRLGDITSFEQLRAVLDRPLRICGMVRNEGEPGGGPFWIKDEVANTQSLQIAESSQVAPQQKELMKSATHFNPVDLVCSPMRHDGTKFALVHYVDPTTGFISEKSKDGRALKAQELPGLWNGAMANWNTVFVEVPITTFAPVKTIADLLRREHQ